MINRKFNTCLKCGGEVPEGLPCGDWCRFESLNGHISRCFKTLPKSISENKREKPQYVHED